MKNRDLASSLFWIGLGAVFVIGAWQQGLIRKGIPGPGFLPFICGIILIGLSLMVLVPALRTGPGEKRGAGKKFFLEKGSLRRLSYAMAFLVGYGIFLPIAGFILTTFVFMLFMFRLMEPQKWSRVFLLAASTAALAYFLFASLEVQLPQGILGI